MASKAEKALNDARSNMDMARKFEQDGKNICSVLDAIKNKAYQVDYLLYDLNEKFDSEVSKLKNVVYDSGTNYLNYDNNARNTVMNSVNLAQVIKIIMDSPILKKDGSLNEYEINSALEKGQTALSRL